MFCLHITWCMMDIWYIMRVWNSGRRRWIHTGPDEQNDKRNWVKPFGRWSTRWCTPSYEWVTIPWKLWIYHQQKPDLWTNLAIPKWGTSLYISGGFEKYLEGSCRSWRFLELWTHKMGGQMVNERPFGVPLRTLSLYIHTCMDASIPYHTIKYINAQIHKYIHTYINKDIQLHTSYMYTYIPTYIHACMHVCVHACIHAYMHTCMHACTHAYIHAYMHTCIHAYMRACMHAYIHTYMYIFIFMYT